MARFIVLNNLQPYIIRNDMKFNICFDLTKQYLYECCDRYNGVQILFLHATVYISLSTFTDLCSILSQILTTIYEYLRAVEFYTSESFKGSTSANRVKLPKSRRSYCHASPAGIKVAIGADCVKTLARVYAKRFAYCSPWLGDFVCVLCYPKPMGVAPS